MQEKIDNNYVIPRDSDVHENQLLTMIKYGHYCYGEQMPGFYSHRHHKHKSPFFFIYKIKTRKRPMLFKSTMHRSSGEAYKCSKCKYLRPTPVQRNLNLEPEPKNLGGAGVGGGQFMVILDAQQGCGITIPVISKTCFSS